MGVYFGYDNTHNFHFGEISEIDEEKRVTRKNIIWIEPSDLMAVLKPERTKLVQYLRKKRRVVFSELMSEMRRTPVSLNNDLKILSRYDDTD